MSDKKKFDPIKKQPEDAVDTIYCSENSIDYTNILNREDVFPYQSPLPKIRRTPEPPII
ncbi:MAG: hypothetical protein J6Q76_00575 [Clostridia bacterium]|nr:hypothetical protein [Clostridia bacterium]